MLVMAFPDCKILWDIVYEAPFLVLYKHSKVTEESSLQFSLNHT